MGSLVGAWVLYGLGAWLGHDRVRGLALRIPLVAAEDIDKTTAWFARHGTKAVFFGRMVPLFRSFISVPAGTERMNAVVFTVLTLLGSLVWNSALISAGYALGANWHAIDPYTATLQYVVLAAVAVWALRFVMTRRRRLRSATPTRGRSPEPLLVTDQAAAGNVPEEQGGEPVTESLVLSRRDAATAKIAIARYRPPGRDGGVRTSTRARRRSPTASRDAVSACTASTQTPSASTSRSGRSPDSTACTR